MRKIFLTAIASMAIATTFALADADVMASRYGNTTVSTDAKGVQTFEFPGVVREQPDRPQPQV